MEKRGPGRPRQISTKPYKSWYKPVAKYPKKVWNPLLMISDDTFKKNLNAIINRSSFHETYAEATDRGEWNTNYMESEVEFDRIAVAMGAPFG